MRVFSIFLLALCMACGTDSSQEPRDTPGSTEVTSDSSSETDSNTDSTDPSDTTTSDDDVMIGSDPTSCGAPGQGLEPIDCTEHGDTNAQCVFSNHCFCTADDGFECEQRRDGLTVEECAEGSTCVKAE